MVNYCCVKGCGRNSRTSKHLYYHGVPKDELRQEQWLIAAGREDLLEKPQEKRNTYRFCSRHFTAQSIKNKHLCNDAMPSLHLPGSQIEADERNDKDSDNRCIHSDILCNNCQANIVGFRYKCVTCLDYDLCSGCEMAEAHQQHLMLRIPNPIKFKNAENMVKKWQECMLNTEDIYGNDSSDDEPIQKYSKNYDSGIDLSDDIKDTIKTVVARVMKLKPDPKKKVSKEKTHKRVSETDKSPKKQKLNREMSYNDGPEVFFADVNEIHSVEPINQVSDVKSEGAFSSNEVVEPDLPVMNIKLSDDLTELMMEVTDHKSLFKY